MNQKTIAVYHKSVPNSKNQEKIDLLNFFSHGAKVVGDLVIDVQDHKYISTDIAIIQGWISDTVRAVPHQTLRDTVIKSQIKNNKFVIGVDSNLFLYSNTDNPLHYLRYSFNGVFPNTGIYCDTEIDPQRWIKISNNLKIFLKPYRISGEHILLCLQRNGGWSMGSYDVQDWAISTINKLRQYTDRPIVIRGHPGDKSAREYLDPTSHKCRLKNIPNIHFSNFNRTLIEDLENCWAAVNHNSSPVVGAAIEGYPIFVTDPVKSQCAEIANLDLSQIENPAMPDRQRWVERLSMFHWNFEELKSGECWSHMRKFII